MELIQGEGGKWQKGFPVEIFFKSELERNAFECWLKSKGTEAFAEWFAGMKKLEGTECMMCRWRDPVQAQCFDGHIQGLGHCVGYEGEP